MASEESLSTTPGRGMVEVGESARSNRFKELRAELISEGQAWLAKGQMARDAGTPLKNDMKVHDGLARHVTEVASDGVTRRMLATTHIGAYLFHKDGVSRFEMAEAMPDGGSHFVAVMADELELAHGGMQAKGAPKVISSVYEEFTNTAGVTHYFGVDVLSNGNVRQRNFDEMTRQHISRVVNVEADLAGLPETVAGMADELF